MISNEEFLKELIENFPSLKDEILEDEDLLHLQVGTFYRYTQKAIDEGDFTKLDKCFSFAHKMFHDANSDLKNAFYVSYLENLSFEGKNGELAKKRMSLLLLKGYEEIMKYLDELEYKFHSMQKKSKK